MAGKDSSDLLVLIEHVKYRSSGAARSPVGCISVYTDRVEWNGSTPDEKLVVPFANIRGQRISPPNKSKTQLQLCLHDGNQETFVFLNPAGDKEVHIKERDLVKETIQQALIGHRQLANQAEAYSEKYSKTRELEAKKKILENNAHLQQLYKHLVASKLISAQDFWGEYYHSKEANGNDQLGISSGFLSSMLQAEGVNSIKINLSVDAIQSIFRTYPSVEKKHLELVPHELTEKQFWSKFFQSHYFHRDREENPDPLDPFSDCIKKDDNEMEKIMKGNVLKKMLDFSYISDDLNLDSDISSANSSNNKELLLKRCNYHSSRVLLASHGNNLEVKNVNESAQIASTSKSNSDERIMIDSEELANDAMQDEMERISFKQGSANALGNDLSSDQRRLFSEKILRLCNRRISSTDKFSLGNATMFAEPLGPFDAVANNWVNGHKADVLNAANFDELQAVHYSFAELLKHFWSCFPPTTIEMEDKLTRMEHSLKHFEENNLSNAEHRFGHNNIAHCRRMLKLSADRYENYVKKRKK